MKFIKTIVNLINFATDKGEAGYYHPSEIVGQVNNVVLQMFHEFVKQYPGNKEIEGYLSPFQKSRGFTLINGQGSMSGLNSEKTRFCVNKATGRRFKIDTPEDFYYKSQSVSCPPSQNYPIATIEGGKIFALPKEIDFTLFYLERPTLAVYGLRQVGDEEVYDDATTTDVQFTPMLHPTIQNRVLESLGINLRDNLMIEFSNLQQQKEAR